MSTPLASIPFIDGIPRPVFLDADGRRQYILDEEGQPVYGEWVYVSELQFVETFKHDRTET